MRRLARNAARYAVVGLGDISQRCFMPSVKHTGNTEIIALVTGYKRGRERERERGERRWKRKGRERERERDR